MVTTKGYVVTDARYHAKAPQYHLPELRGKQSSQRKTMKVLTVTHD